MKLYRVTVTRAVTEIFEFEAQTENEAQEIVDSEAYTEGRLVERLFDHHANVSIGGPYCLVDRGQEP